MKRGRLVAVALVVALSGLAGSAHAVTISMQALTTFGSNGWLPPASFPGDGGVVSTGTGDRIRSVAFNPVSGNLLYASGTSLYSMSATSGSVITQLSNSGVTVGTSSGGISRTLGTVAVTSDGIIYGSNLSANTSTTDYKVYRWASEAATPTTHYAGNAGLPGARVGDNLAVNGSDSTGMLAAGFSNNPTVAGNNSFTTVTTGGVATVGAVSYTGGAAGDFRLGISFANANTVLGAQGGSASARIRAVSFVGTTGSLISSGTPVAPGTERGLLYFTAYGTPLLATQEWGSGVTTNTVRLYDATSLLSTGSLGLIQSINLTTGTNANSNAIGDLAYGMVGGTPTIYALSTNNGIQAFQIVPEPSTTVVVAGCTAGLAALMLRRRGRNA
jgi:hypothetical protein